VIFWNFQRNWEPRIYTKISFFSPPPGKAVYTQVDTQWVSAADSNNCTTLVYFIPRRVHIVTKVCNSHWFYLCLVLISSISLPLLQRVRPSDEGITRNGSALSYPQLHWLMFPLVVTMAWEASQAPISILQPITDLRVTQAHIS
jgi:hypothetical protein